MSPVELIVFVAGCIFMAQLTICSVIAVIQYIKDRKLHGRAGEFEEKIDALERKYRMNEYIFGKVVDHLMVIEKKLEELENEKD